VSQALVILDDMDLPETTRATCRDCDDHLEHCHATSVEHADGTTECLADDPCRLAHALHRWPVACSDLPGACGCARTHTAMAAAA
jgi:hypothetical protein